MPARLSVTCRLNAFFRDSLAGTHFIAMDGELKDPKTGLRIDVQRGDTVCCGVDELNFQGLNNAHWRDYHGTKHWPELIAKYIDMGCERRDDERVVFIGIPTQVGNHSMYDIRFYKELRKILNEFGFRELGRPYRNRNSGNTIVALAGQMPVI